MVVEAAGVHVPIAAEHHTVRAARGHRAHSDALQSWRWGHDDVSVELTQVIQAVTCNVRRQPLKQGSVVSAFFKVP